MTGNRTVTASFLPLLEGGNAVRFFHFVFFVSGSVSFVVFYRSSFLRVAVWKIFGSELLFYGVGVCLVFFRCCFAYVFALVFVLSLPKLSWKNSLDVRYGVFWFFPSPPLVFLADVVVLSVFFFQRDSSGSNRAHPHTHFVFLFLFLSVFPPQPGSSPVLAVRLFFLAFCQGCHSGPRAIWRFLDSLGTWGLRLLAPLLRPFSRTRGGKSASSLLVLVLFFPFLFCFAAAHLF